jgi:antitoxin component YwqK of YwqJK toxin-antitoxin module
MKLNGSIFIFFICFPMFSQNDSIVNFFDNNNKVVTDKSKAKTFEILTKQSDSLWLSRKYKRNGKLYYYQHYNSLKKKLKIGQSVVYNRHGKMVRLSYYNKAGLEHGEYKSWFDNGNLNAQGKLYNGNKEGLFTIYHYNGVLAGKAIFKKDKVIREIYYNTQEEVTNIKDVICKKKPLFKGGIGKYRKELNKLKYVLNYKIDGDVYVNFVIDVNGAIRDVTIDETIPKKLYKQIVDFFESIEGWSPAIDRNRKIPYNYTQKIIFNL